MSIQLQAGRIAGPRDVPGQNLLNRNANTGGRVVPADEELKGHSELQVGDCNEIVLEIQGWIDHQLETRGDPDIVGE